MPLARDRNKPNNAINNTDIIICTKYISVRIIDRLHHEIVFELSDRGKAFLCSAEIIDVILRWSNRVSEIARTEMKLVVGIDEIIIDYRKRRYCAPVPQDIENNSIDLYRESPEAFPDLSESLTNA